MKKRTKRLLAMLLASAMIMQQGSTVAVLATESEPASETVTEKTVATEAETKTPETKAPETQAETKASETTASETQATEAAVNATQTETTTSETTETAAETTEKAADAQTTAPEKDEAKADAEAETKEAGEKADETEAPKTNFTYEDKRVKITAVAQEAAKLPQDAQIHADYMQPGTAAYNEAAAALEAAYAGKDVALSYVFYDIYFTAASAGDGRIEPEAGTVTVSMQFKQPELTPEADAKVQTYDVVHVENGKAQEVPSNVQTTRDGSVASVGFTSGDFSPYAVVMSAEEQDEIATIGADGELDGEPEDRYEYSNDLQDFLNALTFSSDFQTEKVEDGSGNVTLRKGRDYSLHLSFKENEGVGGFDGKQFKSPLTYSLPEGFTLKDLAKQNFSITVKTKDGESKVVEGNEYWIEDGILHVTLSDELSSYADVEFYLDVSAHIEESITGGLKNFGDSISKTVVIDDSASVSAQKTITEYDDDGTAHYKIVVRSDGSNANVHVEDTFGGNILQFQKPVNVTSNKEGFTAPEISYTDKGFSCDIASMSDGEEITFTYSAKVDWSKVTGTVTAEDKTNTVTVKSNNNPDGSTAKKEYGDENHRLSYDWVNKSGKYNEDQKTITWTLEVNKDQKQSAAGLKVTDTIDENSRKYLSFKSGQEITIHVYDGERFIEDRTFELSSENMEGNYGWNYTIPDTDQEHKYRYVFEYTTEVNTNGLINSAEVKNNAEVEGKGSSTSPGIEIKGGHAESKKEVVSSNETEVEWRITVEVPATELSSLTITDTLPGGQWIDGKQVYDSFNEESLEVSIDPNEPLYYKLDNKDKTEHKFTLEFYKDEDKTKSGLNAASGTDKRTITVTFKTKNSEEWVAEASKNDQYVVHKNTAQANVNGYDLDAVTAETSIRVSEKKVTKTVDQGVSDGKIYNDGKIVYQVMLEGVTEDDLPLTLVDKYSEYLKLKTTDLYGTDPKIVGQNDTNGYYSRYEGSSLSFDGDLKDDTDKHELTITVTKDKIPKNEEGKLYPYYFIYYSMQFTVTDELAAKAAENGGTWGINNSVEWKDEKGGTEITYEYSGMTKSIQGSGPSEDNSWTAEFELDVNPRKVDLVDDSDEIIIEDTMSNLMFKPDTLTVSDTDTSGEPLDYDFSYTTDAEGKVLLSIKIKNGDGKHLKIKYQAQVIGNGSVTITNDAKIKGTIYGNSTSKDVTVQTDGGGSGSQQKITVYKYKEGSISTPLPGAQFKLYVQHDGTWKECNPAGKSFFEVNSKGTVDISGDADTDGWTLTAGTWKLVETKTPEGYEGNLNKEVIFTLGNSLTGASNEYIFGSTIPIPNDNEAGSLKLIKAIGGDLSANAQTLKKIFKFTVKGPDKKYYGPSGQISDEPIEIEVTAEAPVTLSDLPLGNYTVEELSEGVDVAGYTLSTKITNDGVITVAAGPAAEATVTNTYTRKITGSLTVTKAVTGDKAPEDGEEYTVEITTLDNVKLDTTDVVVTDAVADSVKKGTKKISFKIMAGGSVTVTGLPQATYTITETLASGATYTASYVVDKGSSTETAPKVTFDTDTTDATVAITNDYGNKTGSLTVTKAVVGNKAPTTEEEYEVEIATTADVNLSTTDVVVTGAVAGSVEQEAKKISFKIKNNGSVTVTGLPQATYTVTETSASGATYTASYVVDKNPSTETAPTVTFNTDKTDATVAITNDYGSDVGKLHVTKVVTGTKAPTPGVPYDVTVETTDETINLLDESLTVTVTEAVEGSVKKEAKKITFQIMGGKTVTIDGLPLGTYTVTETVSGTTYTASYKVDNASTKSPTVTFSNTGTIKSEATVEITNDYGNKTGKLMIQKNVTVNGKETTSTEADGTYTFKVKKNGETAEKTVSITIKNGESGTVTVDDLEPGTYTVTEVTDELSANIHLVGTNGVTVTVEDSETAATVPTAEFTNNKVKLEIDKVDATTGKSLAGAEFVIIRNDLPEGETFTWSWRTDGQPHDITGLASGEYTLKETKAPDGYTLADPINFTVNAEGKIVVNGKEVYSFVMEDTKNKVSILKVDESGKALAGATLIVKDKDGKVVADPWTSDGEAHEITGLAPGTYTLSELEAPKGYQVSENVTFEVTGNETDKDMPIKVQMTDKKIVETKRSLKVTKRLHLDGITSDIMVRTATYYVALFTDAARTQRVTDVKKIVFNNENTSSATFDNLAAGVTYYVGETDENGTVIPAGKISENMIYYPTYDDNATFKFEGKKAKEEGLAEFTNVYTEWPNYFYLSGQLTVTKQVLLGGEECDSEDTFYARVFNDAKLTDPVSDEVLVLDMAGGSRTSVTVTNLPIGDTPESSRKYYVAETDEYGNPLDPDEVTEYTISIDKSEVTLDASSATPEVVITNDFHEEESEFESESEVDEKKTAPKTGDDTNFAKYLFLLTLSAGTCAVLFEEKRRKDQTKQ